MSRIPERTRESRCRPELLFLKPFPIGTCLVSRGCCFLKPFSIGTCLASRGCCLDLVDVELAASGLSEIR